MRPRAAAWKATVLAGGIAALVVALGRPALAVHEKVVVKPALLVTLYAARQHDQDWVVCFPFVFTCPLATHGLKLDEEPPVRGMLVVGFDHFYWPGADPCPCDGFEVEAYRGVVKFNTRDIPHQFVSATLVLVPGLTEAEGHDLSENIVASVFETSNAAASFAADDGDSVNGSIDNELRGDGLRVDFFPGAPPTVTRQVTDLGSEPLTDLVYQTAGNPKVQKKQATYRMDVTERVQKWVADWPNRNKVAQHGFVFVTTDESLPTTMGPNSVLWAMYNVTLEFDIDEPDR
jgi:hypothetical protein